MITECLDDVTTHPHNASRTFSSPFGAKYGGTYQQYALADAGLASKVGLIRIASASLPLTLSL